MSLSVLRPAAARALRPMASASSGAASTMSLRAALRQVQMRAASSSSTSSTASASSPTASVPWRKVLASVAVLGAAGIGASTVLCETSTPAAADPANTTTTKPDDYDPLRDSELRYAGYSARIARILASLARTLAGKVRYLGYTSDIGESARPILDVKYVNFLYGVTFAYVIGDVLYQGYRTNEDGYDRMEVARTMTQTATFQGVVSVVMPSLIIHQGVHWSKKLFEAAPGRIKVFGPVIVGLCIIPFLPYLDHPAEDLINTGFCKVWPSKYPERNHGHKVHHEHAHDAADPAALSPSTNSTAPAQSPAAPVVSVPAPDAPKSS